MPLRRYSPPSSAHHAVATVVATIYVNTTFLLPFDYLPSVDGMAMSYTLR